MLQGKQSRSKAYQAWDVPYLFPGMFMFLEKVQMHSRVTTGQLCLKSSLLPHKTCFPIG